MFRKRSRLAIRPAYPLPLNYATFFHGAKQKINAKNHGRSCWRLLIGPLSNTLKCPIQRRFFSLAQNSAGLHAERSSEKERLGKKIPECWRRRSAKRKFLRIDIPPTCYLPRRALLFVSVFLGDQRRSANRMSTTSYGRLTPMRPWTTSALREQRSRCLSAVARVATPMLLNSRWS
jgi:hypothetical protein